MTKLLSMKLIDSAWTESVALKDKFLCRVSAAFTEKRTNNM